MVDASAVGGLGVEIGFTDFVQSNLDIEMATAAHFGLRTRIAAAQCRTEADVVKFGRGLQALVVQEAPLTRTVLRALPELRCVSFAQVGTNSIDLEAASELGIWVANVPDANVTEVAAHAAAMTLALVRHLPRFDVTVRAGSWNYSATGELIRPSRLVVGLVGLGRIGRHYAAMMRPIVGNVRAYDPCVSTDRWPVEIQKAKHLEDLLAAADVVSLHLPLTQHTRGLMNAKRFAQMKKGAILINVSRGALVEIPALLLALDSGHLDSAGLDVLPVEPPDPQEAILQHPNVLMSPHAAFYSVDSDVETRTRAVASLAAFGATGRPLDVVIEGRR